LEIDNINNDEYMDVMAVTSADKVWVIDGKNGNEIWHWNATNNLYSIATGDLNNDGQIDVVVAGYDRVVTALYGNNGTIIWQFFCNR